MLNGGFIVIHRKILEWEWIKSPTTLCLFIHLILAANYEDKRFQGMEVKRGQLVTSLASLSEATGLSIQQTRTALSHLISTGEITNQSYANYRLITIANYDLYQDKQQSKQQTINKRSTKQATNDQQQWNNINNINKETNSTLTGTIGAEAPTTRHFVKPTLEEVAAYCRERGNNVDPEKWMDHYTSNGWKVGKNQMRDWKAAVRTWEKGEYTHGNNSGTDGGSGSTKSKWSEIGEQLVL